MSVDPGHQAAVLGAGSWGTALAIHLAGIGRTVRLWGRDAALMQEMAARARQSNLSARRDVSRLA